MASPFTYRIEAEDPTTHARAGVLTTPHGDVPTPIFMPVGTKATVKGIEPERLAALGAKIVLANTYHLALRPGEALIAELGGLHRFMGWEGPILTDSGGFQVFSHREFVKLSDDGVAFSAVDYGGERIVWTPEENMRIAEALGSDIAMQLDVCPPFPAPEARLRRAVDLSAAWAERCYRAHRREDQALFGIVQGGMDVELREESIRRLQEAGDFPGFGIGGYSVGEDHETMYASLGAFVPRAMPADKPRYVMGVGDPETLLRAVGFGCDMFDCVLPTRTARMGTALTWRGKLNLRNAAHATDGHPLSEGCGCPTCAHGFSRAYLHHLVKSREMLGAILLTQHNLFFLLDLMRRAREAIVRGSYAAFRDAALASLGAA